MDRLINYIEWRSAKYGAIKGTASAKSMYYTIGVNLVRISDHMKYSENSGKNVDYYFIIQPNDTYIFIPNPKLNSDGKMYMRIVTYSEAKEFIKSLHDFAIQYESISKWYRPEYWNREPVTQEEMKEKSVTDKPNGRLTWEDFKTKYMEGDNGPNRMSVVSRLETLVYGCPQKGNINTKMLNMSTTYDKLTSTQYNTLMTWLGEA